MPGNWWEFPLTQGYGPTDEPLDSGYAGYAHFNKGYDYGTPPNTPITALVGGRVVQAGPGSDGWGTSVKIVDAQGNTHNYGHLNAANVKVGDTIAPGQVVGASGSTGNSTGPHLSYDVWTPKGEFIDPKPFISPPAVGSGGLQTPPGGSNMTNQAYDEFGFPLNNGSTANGPVLGPPNPANGKIGGIGAATAPATGALSPDSPPAGYELVGPGTARKIDPVTNKYIYIEYQTAGYNPITGQPVSEAWHPTGGLPQPAAEAAAGKPAGFVEYDAAGHAFVNGARDPSQDKTPTANQPQGGVSEADLRTVGAQFTAPGLAIYGGKEYKRLSDGSWSISGDAATAKAKALSPAEQAAAARANVTRIASGQAPQGAQGATAGGGIEAAPVAAGPAPAPAVSTRGAATAYPLPADENGISGYNYSGRTIDPTVPQGNRSGPGQPLASILMPDTGSGRLTLTPYMAAEGLRTAGLVPSGNFEQDAQAYLGLDAKRSELQGMGFDPLQTQSIFDQQNSGLSQYQQGRSANTAMNAAEKGMFNMPYKENEPWTLLSLSKYLDAQEVPAYAEGTQDEPIIAGVRSTEEPGFANLPTPTGGMNYWQPGPQQTWQTGDAYTKTPGSPWADRSFDENGFGGTYATPLGDMTSWRDMNTGAWTWKDLGAGRNGPGYSDFQSLFQPGTQHGYSFDPYSTDPFGAQMEQRYLQQTPLNQARWAAQALADYHKNARRGGAGIGGGLGGFPMVNQLGQSNMPQFAGRNPSDWGGGHPGAVVAPTPQAPSGATAYYGGLDPRLTMPTFADGGQMMTDEPVVGMGMMSGQPKFMAGEAGPEAINITPAAPPITPFAQLVEQLFQQPKGRNRQPPMKPVGSTMGAAA